MTVVVLRTVPVLRRRRCSLHGDGHVRRIRDDVVDGRALLRLGDQRLDVLPTRVGIDIVGDLDPLEAVADLVIDSEDALDIHVAFERRRHRLQLDIAILRDRRDSGGQAAREADQDIFDRRGSQILGREALGVIGIERKRLLAPLLLAEAVEALHGRMAMGAVLPLTGGTPLELSSNGCVGERFACTDQCFHVDSVVYRLCRFRHRTAPLATGNKPILTQNK